MRRRTKVLVVVSAAVLVVTAVFFLFAPIFYWGSFSPYQLGSNGCAGTNIACIAPQFYPTYGSLSCQIFGIGYMYSPYWGNGLHGIRAGCSIPPVFTNA